MATAASVRRPIGRTERPEIEMPPTDMFREQLEEFALAIRGRARVEAGAAEAGPWSGQHWNPRSGTVPPCPLLK